MKVLAILALLSVALQLALAAPSDKVDCSKLDEVLDDLGGAQGITTLNDKYKLVTSEEEHAKRCQVISDAFKLLRRYNKECIKSLTQEVFSAVLRTRTAMMEPRCKPKTPEAVEAIEANKCIHENSLEKVKDAERKAILSLQVLNDANIADDKVRLRRSCCSVLDSKAFFLEATKEKCSKFEGIYAEYADSYTSEAMGLMCEAPEKLKCSELEALKLDGVQMKSKFFFDPMLKLVKSLDRST